MKSLITFGNFGWGMEAIKAFNDSPATKAIQRSGICKKVQKTSKKGRSYSEFQVPKDKEELVKEIYSGFALMAKPSVSSAPYEFIKHDLGQDQSKVVNTLINDCFNGSKSFIIQAMAGAGKTYTCFEYLLNEYASQSGNKQSILGLCFGRANADELQRKCPPVRGWDFRNFHSLGYRALANHLGRKRIQPNNKKARYIINKLPTIVELWNGDKSSQFKAVVTTEAIEKAVSLVLNCLIDYNDESALSNLLDHYWNSLVSPSKKGGLDYEILLESIPQVIDQSIKDMKSFSFDEMLYLVVKLDLPLAQYDIVMIDEAQDTNPARIAIAEKCLKSNGRLIAIGDKNQNIMGFTGCSFDSMEQIKDKFQCKELTLNTTRRNPGKVAEFVSEMFGIEIKCLEEKKVKGSVEELSIEELKEGIGAGDMILCRKRSDCVPIALNLLAEGKEPLIVGDLTLIQSLLSVALKADSDSPSIAIQKLQESNEDNQSNGDDIEKTCIKLLESSITMIDYIRKVFSLLGEDSNDKIRIMTGHKSKGLEADNVYCMRQDHSFGMFFNGQKEHETAQERNLEYVAYTRSLDNLYMVGI